MSAHVLPLEKLRMTDVASVGGKNASLGELISQLAASNVRVPGGFATTARAFEEFLEHNQLKAKIDAILGKLNVDDVSALAKAGAEVRAMVEAGKLPPALEKAIHEEYARISHGTPDASFAVRSSATAEDLPDASFAGQQETYLNIRGIENVLDAVLRVYASLYNDRAIAYRVHKNFKHEDVAISAGVQRMVRSDLGAAGVMFTMDTESGFPDVVFITSSYGLGETVVQGSVNPDEFYVSKVCLAAGKPAVLRRSLGGKAIKLVFSADPKPGKSVEEKDVAPGDRDRFSLSDSEVEELARYAVSIEKHYGRPMDIEWGRDGTDGKLYILQARPETVKSQETQKRTLTRYRIGKRGEVLSEGRAIGSKIGQGKVRIVTDIAEIARVQEGDVLVTDMTDPNWEPVMKRTAAIITNRGGRTCHSAIIARELGIPAVVGCEDATERLRDGMDVTVSCAEGDTGYIYAGKLQFDIVEVQLDKMPKIPVKIAMNVGNPQLAFDFAQLPNEGVGLARLEFIISNMIGVHPKACLEYDKLQPDLKAQVTKQSRGYPNPVAFYREKIVEGVATIAAAFWPKKVIVRLSDFKSNEYRNLIGGAKFEPSEENPMLGFRGASRYIAASFRDCFRLECEAMKKVRDEMGLTNVEIMIPFVRTLKESEQVHAILKENGLERGKNGLRVVMMCEIPSNAILADEFLKHYDGFSIGSNDMTQLTLALDRDSGLVMEGFDERDAAVKQMLHLAIDACRRAKKYVGICGQGPSDYPDLAEWLMSEGIESMSLNPDTVVETWLHLAKASEKVAG
ncbi:Phosphoenolpyruvate synthase [Usitatibacter rugosus]|uniref:Phosphoenolpyruvate synthase n=1 Tax=Usitatibacter rugosus TaxID=2732067 RepID=A0A6M4GRP7_9PROT|nr:phosphoenolpyruvate synthase [Usitatibacter rugosus]QJR09999.1 Phosphoenolpyruvate synthase [Usitatibacter rugosus]